MKLKRNGIVFEGLFEPIIISGLILAILFLLVRWDMARSETFWRTVQAEKGQSR